ncbi:sulfite exporter TauE/SafE family protein [Saccharopolyspora sp. HNM0983]|uniref:Probable membrane transporter protein n=1 Tax=Saccharopolyspora montiporae TaxID=2781240 RepID=A0A929BFM4_9PSEU|nr:sulfite exporter TauE/SafE family protein [Saccharopolyspora sp. HNM0983]MBE9376557.1 sulfite exporter TauE/SafE family protein [Saccharopolyspora sp. HNM0983]
MTVPASTLVALLAISVFAGGAGALAGIGGGAIIVPVLVLGYGFSFQTAVATSLAAVIANSAMGASTYLRQGLTHLRLSFRLEIATTIGGITGGLASSLIPRPILEGVFAVVQFFAAWLSRRKTAGSAVIPDDRGSTFPPDTLTTMGLRACETDRGISGLVTDEHDGTTKHWTARKLWLGSGVSVFAGFMSGLLGVGGGFLKIPAMNIGMGIPLRVATASSQFMIGITAVSGFLVYFAKGDVLLFVVAPIVLGVTLGSRAGVILAGKVSISVIRWVYVSTIVASGAAFALSALGVTSLGGP